MDQRGDRRAALSRHAFGDYAEKLTCRHRLDQHIITSSGDAALTRPVIVIACHCKLDGRPDVTRMQLLEHPETVAVGQSKIEEDDVRPEARPSLYRVGCRACDRHFVAAGLEK